MVLQTVRPRVKMLTATVLEVEEVVAAAVVAIMVHQLLTAVMEQVRNRCMVTSRHPPVLINHEVEVEAEDAEEEVAVDLIVDEVVQEPVVMEARARCPAVLLHIGDSDWHFSRDIMSYNMSLRCLHCMD